MGTAYIVSGPSGVGKATVIRHVQEKQINLPLSLSCTTRPPRVGEVSGVHYRFVTRETFIRLRDQNDFLEWAMYDGEFYGTLRSESEKQLRTHDLLFEVEVIGARKIKQALSNVVSFFILPPSLEELERRLRGRDPNFPEEKIQARLKRAREEIQHQVEFDFTIVNADAREAANELYELICVNRQIRPNRY